MIELTVQLSEETFKKARALSILRSIPAGQMDALLASLIDKALNAEVLSELGITNPHPSAPTQVVRHAARPVARDEFADDVSGIGVGLGDHDPGDTPEEVAARGASTLSKRQPAPPPAVDPTGVTEEALDKDMDLDDPEHEAKVDAPTFADQMETAEEAFGAASGYAPPAPAAADEPLPASTRRKRQITGVKGRVSAATEAN